MTEHKNVHIYLPELNRSRGGIQSFAADFLKACEKIREIDFKVFIKNDLKQQVCTRCESKNFGNWPGILRTLAFASGFLLAIVKKRPNLVILGHIRFVPLAMILRFFNIPYWIVAYGMEVRQVKSSFYIKLLRAADRCLSISSATSADLEKFIGLKPEQIFLLPCAVDGNKFFIDPKQRSKRLEKFPTMNDKKLLLLTVCRLDSRQNHKGYNQVIEALASSKELSDQILYVLVGGGDNFQITKAKVDSLGLSKDVLLTGDLSESDLVTVYQAADLFILPSSYEGFGIVYLEALAAGVPVIACAGSGADDALDHGRLGTLLASNDSENIKKELVLFLQEYKNGKLTTPDKDLREKVLEKFGIQVFDQRVKEMFEIKQL